MGIIFFTNIEIIKIGKIMPGNRGRFTPPPPPQSKMFFFQEILQGFQTHPKLFLCRFRIGEEFMFEIFYFYRQNLFLCMIYII